MTLSEPTERAIEACHDAVLAPELWPVALQGLSDSLDAASCSFYAIDKTAMRLPMSAEHLEFDELWHRNQSHAPCVYARKAPCRRGMRYVVEQQIVTAEERDQEPYFQEIARPANRDWWAAVCFSVADRQWCLSLYRDAARGPFTHAEAGYAALAGPRLSRLVADAERFGAMQAASTLSALDRLNCAAMVIDSRGIARHLNRSAEAIMGDDFRLAAGRPMARDGASNRRLQTLMSAIRSAEWGGVPTFDQVVIDRDCCTWLLIEAMPVTAFGSDLFGEGRAVLLLTDLTAPLVTDQTLLAHVFRLTAAEAKMAARIAAGDSINEAACALGVSRETARTQLKAAFQKTNTRSQLELLALISRLRPASRE